MVQNPDIYLCGCCILIDVWLLVSSAQIKVAYGRGWHILRVYFREGVTRPWVDREPCWFLGASLQRRSIFKEVSQPGHLLEIQSSNTRHVQFQLYNLPSTYGGVPLFRWQLQQAQFEMSMLAMINIILSKGILHYAL